MMILRTRQVMVMMVVTLEVLMQAQVVEEL
jgi:hypothetical protein